MTALWDVAAGLLSRYKIAIYAAAALILFLCGLRLGFYLKGVELESFKAEVALAGAAREVQTAQTVVKQVEVTGKVNDETTSRIAASDQYYRLRVDRASGGQLPAVPKAAGEPDAAAAQPAPGAATCNPADAAADAIMVLQWQEWARQME